MLLTRPQHPWLTVIVTELLDAQPLGLVTVTFSVTVVLLPGLKTTLVPLVGPTIDPFMIVHE